MSTRQRSGLLPAHGPKHPQTYAADHDDLFLRLECGAVKKRLDGRNVFVTGASRGIGRAIAIACAREGAFVGVGYHQSREGAEATAKEIADGGAASSIVAIDVTDTSSVEHAITTFAKERGGKLDALVANAGAVTTGLLATADVTALKKMIDVNVLGPIACARASLPLMLPNKRGVLIFIGSVVASRPARGQAAYASSKAAVETLTRAIAVEYGRKGIRAVCIRPGAVDTDMLAATRALAEDEVLGRIPMKRVGTVDEIAAMATMLLSDDASYVNGAIVDVDGGYGAG